MERTRRQVMHESGAQGGAASPVPGQLEQSLSTPRSCEVPLLVDIALGVGTYSWRRKENKMMKA